MAAVDLVVLCVLVEAGVPIEQGYTHPLKSANCTVPTESDGDPFRAGRDVRGGDELVFGSTRRLSEQYRQGTRAEKRRHSEPANVSGRSDTIY